MTTLSSKSRVQFIKYLHSSQRGYKSAAIATAYVVVLNAMKRPRQANHPVTVRVILFAVFASR